MKKILSLFAAFMVSVSAVFAQADKVVGEYKCERNGIQSKIKVFKYEDGYRAQVFWVDNLKMEDGSTRLDPKNPDVSKRNTRADQIVLISKVKFNGKDSWDEGKIYDPTSGKVYSVTLSFKNDKTLKVRGYLGTPILGESMFWTKIK